jgi:hypothetical protein
MLAVNWRHSSDQESRVPLGRFMSQDRAIPIKAIEKYLAMMALFPPAARMEVE